MLVYGGSERELGLEINHYKKEKLGIRLYRTHSLVYLLKFLSREWFWIEQEDKMRELRFEDALMYLEQVKMEFEDRPQIYNEFLDIMKNFKSQQIDTPGVIERDSNLFHGKKVSSRIQ